MASPLDSLAGALAGRYTVERELGHGGMAIVYFAHDLKHNRQVAIKVLRPELAAALGAERFLREITIAAQLHHPHILPLYDSGEAAGLLYYVMPFVEGESLRDRLTREKQLTIEDALQITREVADALSYAHRHDVMHRDIKPENILLESGHAIVADFGIARAITAAGGDTLTGTGIAVGTPSYMSPEQASQEHHLDGRSDVYSLGCVAYEMLVGEPPYTGATPQAIMARQLSTPVPSLRVVRATVPAVVEQAIVKALAKAPADRFATARQLADALDHRAVAEQSRVGVLRPRWVRRAAGVVLGIGAGLVLWRVVLNSPAIPGTLSSRAQPASQVPAPYTIAVLYFDNLTRDSAYAYLADGITVDLITLLGRVTRLDVKSRYESARLRGVHGLSLSDIGRELNVAYFVDGSVQTGSGRMRVNAELIEASSGHRVWGERLTVSGTDPLAVQESITTAVVGAVVGALLPEERTALHRRATRDSAAYDLYLRGRFFASRFELQQALELYRQALMHDSTFAPAWAGIAQALYWKHQGQPAVQGFAGVRQAAQRALTLDSSVALAYLALAQSAHEVDRDFVRAETLARRAIAFDPRLAEAHAFLSWVLIDRGRAQEALAESERAWQLDSLSTTIEISRWNTLQLLGRASDVLTMARARKAVFWEAHALLLLRRCAEAREVLKPAERAWITYWEQAIAAACLGEKNAARVALDSLIATTRETYVESSKLAAVYAAMGNVDQAYRLLDRADKNREWDVLYLNAPWWWFAPLQADPRFLPLIRRLGLPWPAPQVPN